MFASLYLAFSRESFSLTTAVCFHRWSDHLRSQRGGEHDGVYACDRCHVRHRQLSGTSACLWIHHWNRYRQKNNLNSVKNTCKIVFFQWRHCSTWKYKRRRISENTSKNSSEDNSDLSSILAYLQGEHRRRLTTRFILNTFCSWCVMLRSERRTHSPSPSPSSSSSSDSSTGS